MDTFLDMIFWVVLGGILGARIFFVILNFPYFLDNPVEILMVHHGGLAWQGSLIAGTIVGIIFVRMKKWDPVRVLDLSAPYLALGQSIGRVGCFLNGCCYGKEASWGIYFPVHDARLHPTQLYSTIGLFFVFLFLRAYRAKARPGDVFVLYLVLASVLRFIVEFFRADHYAFFAGLSVFQWVCLGILAVAFSLRAWVIHRGPPKERG